MTASHPAGRALAKKHACGLCGKPLVAFRGRVIVCPHCDLMALWFPLGHLYGACFHVPGCTHPTTTGDNP